LILAEGLRGGDRLPSERQLAEQTGVSRTVVREAVRALVGKGIVQARPGRGLTVATVDGSTVVQSVTLYLHKNHEVDYEMVHEVRTLLEVQTAGLAALRATDSEVEQLRHVCAQMADHLDDVEAASLDDVAFHRLLASATHNPLYDVLLEALAAPLMMIRRETFRLRGRAAVALNAHRMIMAMVSLHDSDGARDQMRRHLYDVESVWRAMLQAGDGSAVTSVSTSVDAVARQGSNPEYGETAKSRNSSKSRVTGQYGSRRDIAPG
jgi:GntR family transcriptional repressor for pyruvate dehydrogenase complex